MMHHVAEITHWADAGILRLQVTEEVLGKDDARHGKASCPEGLELTILVTRCISDTLV